MPIAFPVETPDYANVSDSDEEDVKERKSAYKTTMETGSPTFITRALTVKWSQLQGQDMTCASFRVRYAHARHSHDL
jgi:hypothetical protein